MDDRIIQTIPFDDMEVLAVLSWEIKDPHTELAKRLFNTDAPSEDMRRMAKTINYGVIYGGYGC